jgi:hypothetical protein
LALASLTGNTFVLFMFTLSAGRPQAIQGVLMGPASPSAIPLLIGVE